MKNCDMNYRPISRWPVPPAPYGVSFWTKDSWEYWCSKHVPKPTKNTSE